jgi:hypothetical protein
MCAGLTYLEDFKPEKCQQVPSYGQNGGRDLFQMYRVKAFNQVRFQFSKLDYSGKSEPKVLNFANVFHVF